MPKFAFLNANFRGKYATIHMLGTKRAIVAISPDGAGGQRGVQ